MTASVRHGRTDAKWVGQVYLGRHNVTGKHIRKNKTFTAPWTRAGRSEAQLQFVTWVASLDRAELLGGGPTPSTVNELLDRWLITSKGRWTAKTFHNYEQKCQSYIRPHLGTKAIDQVTGADLDMLYAHLLDFGGKTSSKHPKGRPLSGTTVHSIHFLLGAVFGQAVKWRELAYSPTDGATSPKKDTVEIIPPTAEQLSKLAVAATVTPLRAGLFWLACATGARRSQLLGVRWSDVDLEAATVLFRTGVISDNGTVVIKGTKSERPYVVSIDPDVVTDLRKVKVAQAENSLACGVPMVEDPFLFGFQPGGGTPWHPDAVSKWWSYCRKKSGVSTVRFHDLRHYCATTMLANGDDIRTVAGRLGHANPKMTLQVYAHFLPEQDRKAADNMGATLKGIRSA